MAGTRITVQNNGSIRVEGEFELVDAQGAVIDVGGRTRVSLCRCGHSANKPYCDGAHKAAGFQSVIVAADAALPAPQPPAANPGA
jgi:CDGSH-type Zn-finger protein